MGEEEDEDSDSKEPKADGGEADPLAGQDEAEEDADDGAKEDGEIALPLAEKQHDGDDAERQARNYSNPPTRIVATADNFFLGNLNKESCVNILPYLVRCVPAFRCDLASL